MKGREKDIDMEETKEEIKDRKPGKPKEKVDAEAKEQKAPKPTAKPEEKEKMDKASPASDDHEGMSLKEVIQEQATEDEMPQSSKLSLRKILGGDILNTAAIRRQIWLFVLITFFFIIYISNRYSCQQDIIEIDRLQKELLDAKYKALSSNSQLTEKSRESNVLELLKNNKDSTLKIASQPPYIINVPEEK